MKPFALPFLVAALVWSPAEAKAGWRAGRCVVKEDPAAVAAREARDEQLKWVVAAGGVGFVGYTVWQYLRESAKAARAARRKREPWEMV